MYYIASRRYEATVSRSGIDARNCQGQWLMVTYTTKGLNYVQKSTATHSAKTEQELQDLGTPPLGHAGDINEFRTRTTASRPITSLQ
jgi:hypothetical protein